MHWRKSPGKRPNPLSAYSPAFRHGAIALCFVPWPHTHGPIFRYVTTTPFITSGRIQAASRGDSRPGSAERTARPEAIGRLNSDNGARRRLVVRARSDDGFGSDSQSGSGQTTDSEPIRDLDPIERSKPVKKSLLRGISQADPALTAKISEVRGYRAETPAMKHFVKHARPGEMQRAKERPMPIELKSTQIHSGNPPKRRYFVNEAALCLHCAILRASEQLARMG